MAELRLIEKVDAEAVAQHAALLVKRHLLEKPGSPIVFPTGKTPKRLYEILRDDRSLDWSQTPLFHLDEYVPAVTPSEKPLYQSFQQALDEELWSAIEGQKHYFIDDIGNPTHYEKRLIDAGGPGLILLGIGGNGHIAFNEPPCEANAPTCRVPLMATTLKANFGLDAPNPNYPNAAVTLGLGLILKAGEIVLLATGINKQAILRRAFDSLLPPEAACPASWLKMHPNVSVLSDFTVF
jgi:glucosamine-6-phosphate deaminase